MPVLIFVCDDEELATDLEEAFLNATGDRALYGALQEKRELRGLAEAVCIALNIATDSSHLVQLLGGNPGMTNLRAVSHWCGAALPDLDASGSALVDALASRLYSYLISKMH